MGVLVVVSAGNEGGAVDSPANCPGVAAIAGLRHAGTKVGFSSLGPEIAVGAPAGNCVNTTITAQSRASIRSARRPIPEPTPVPTTMPTPAARSTWMTSQGPNLGTSFSAPIVSGIAGLMSSVNGNLKSTSARRAPEGGFGPVSADSQPERCRSHRVSCSERPDGYPDGGMHLHVRWQNLRRRNGQCLGRGEGGITADCGGQIDGRRNRDTRCFRQCRGLPPQHCVLSVGRSSPGTHPVSSSTGTTTTVSAASAGSPFTVTLTVKDDAGLQDTAVIT